MLTRQQPYGFRKFGQAGLALRAEYDSRDRVDVFDNGYEVRVHSSYFPSIWDVETPFGSVDGELGVHFGLADRAFVSLYGGEKKLWGEFPFFDAAYIGGRRSAAAYHWNRFAGGASAYGIAELRWPLKRFHGPMPGELGIALEAGEGRVWFEGEDSDTWHRSVGAGLFYAPFHRAAYFEIGAARSPEQTVLLFSARLSFLGF